MKFSIVIPVYKAEEYLDQCVESVLGQTYTDMEVILVDDGSPDRCGAMCDAWAEKDQRIKVIHQENGGAAAARNHGIRYASGDYLLCLDSDDWWDNNTVLGIIASQLKLTPVDVLSFNYRKSYDGVLQPPYFNGSLESSQKSESLEQILKKDVWVSGPCNKAVSIRLLKEHDLYFREGVTAEDLAVSVNFSVNAEEVTDAILVDRKLLTQESGKFAVNILEDDMVKKRYVTVASNNLQTYWILDGLTEGQTLVMN